MKLRPKKVKIRLKVEVDQKSKTVLLIFEADSKIAASFIL